MDERKVVVATIRDVAEAAGVSIATVSRALRGLPSVAPSTRSRVEEVARRLSYVPDPYASRLSSSQGHTILVAVPLPGQWYYAQVVEGVEAVASEQGFDLQLHVVADDWQRRRFIDEVLPQQKRIDGAILVDVPLSAGDAGLLVKRGNLLIAVGQHVDDVVSIRIDNRTAAHQATMHLTEAGHIRIGLLGGMPDGRSHLSIPGEREEGFKKALEDAGVELDESIVVNGNFSIDGGAEAARELLGLGKPPTAVFALSDEMAVGVMQTARQMKVAIPGALSLVGFDDHEFSSAIGLTTVRQPVVEMGSLAAQALLDAIAGNPWPEDRVVEHQLVVRDTTAPI
ncbi:MAG: LacI family DNA-binding transcriptional regulator [Acidimicrobiia bacterium]